MPNPVHETSAVTAEWAWSAPEQPASDSAPRCHETQTELARANRVAIPEQLSASIAEINQPISAVDMNAEAALRLSSPSRQIRKQFGGCSLVSSRTECALATSLTAPVR
jgi:C4-dicarboxylate-specific signal transduction histidine kinase